MHIVAKGANPGGSGEIAYCDTASGGEISSFGSINYPSSILVDDAVSHITASALRRFLMP